MSPRRNNRRRSVWTRRPPEPDETPAASPDQMARKLVLNGVCDPVILGPVRYAFSPDEPESD